MADDSFDPGHFCYSNAETAICQAQIAIRSTPGDTNSGTVDFYTVPHRGYWGIDQSVPENSVAAINLASEHGFGAVELDITRVDLVVTTDQNGLPYTNPADMGETPPSQFIGSHDFVLPRLTTSDSSEFLFELDVSELTSLTLRERDGSPSQYKMMSLLDAFRAAAENDVVIMVDTRPVKAHMIYDSNNNAECVAFCDFVDGGAVYTQAYAENIRDVIRYALDNEDGVDYTPYLVFKIPLPADYIIDFVGDENFRKVLWMVQANPTKLSWYAQNVLQHSDYTADIQDLADFVDAWDLEYGKSVSCYETAYKPNSSDIRIQGFSRQAKNQTGAYFSIGDSPYAGNTYTTLMGYIYLTTAMRSGTFSGEPVGPRGLVNEYAAWRMNPDSRANQLQMIDYDYARIMVITSDRPDVWIEIQSVLE